MQSAVSHVDNDAIRPAVAPMPTTRPGALRSSAFNPVSGPVASADRPRQITDPAGEILAGSSCFRAQTMHRNEDRCMHSRYAVDHLFNRDELSSDNKFVEETSHVGGTSELASCCAAIANRSHVGPTQTGSHTVVPHGKAHIINELCHHVGDVGPLSGFSSTFN